MDKRAGQSILRDGVDLLARFQDRLAAQDTHGLLVCLQALDAAGKDGTIRHVMSGVNPQGVHVSSFKVPSSEELGHDYLWRYARRLPARGEIGIFNRSHYEEVLVVRVHPELLERQRLAPEAKAKGVWARRFGEINDWERYLTDNGITVLKILLNISKEEQRRRFLRRLDLPDHNWKFSAADARETPVLGRLPARPVRDALAHEHPLGTVVGGPRRPQMVRPDLRRGHLGERPRQARSPLPDRDAAPAAGGARPPGPSCWPRPPPRRPSTRSGGASGGVGAPGAQGPGGTTTLTSLAPRSVKTTAPEGATATPEG